jgi:hypothetical protein
MQAGRRQQPQLELTQAPERSLRVPMHGVRILRE